MSRTVFMIMPFNIASSTSAYNRCIRPLCDKLSLSINRADDYRGTGPVYDDIVTGIRDATIIVADITGSNPNVFYELGIAHTLKQTRTIIINSDEFEKVPFDVRHFRIVKYEDSMAGADELAETLEATFKGLLLDLRETHSDDFRIAMEILDHTNQQSFIYTLLGLAKYTSIIRRTDPISVEGHHGEHTSWYNSIGSESFFSMAIALGYAEEIGDQIILTELGRAFADYLSEYEYVCDVFNEQVFTKNYVPLHERLGQAR